MNWLHKGLGSGKTPLAADHQIWEMHFRWLLWGSEWSSRLKGRNCVAAPGAAQLGRASPHAPKGCGLTPGQGPCRRQPVSVSLLHRCLSAYLPPFHINEKLILWWGLKIKTMWVLLCALSPNNYLGVKSNKTFVTINKEGVHIAAPAVPGTRWVLMEASAPCY